jgi:PKD repeat protein
VVNTTGNYSVVVENEFGCTASDNVNVTINQVPQLNLTAIDESAPNANDGSVTANVSGGATPYTYNWTGSSGTGSQITGLGDGTYCVTVTDNNGCSVDDCATIVTLSPTPIANFEANQTSACGNITVNFTDNSLYAPTSWLWNFGDGNTSSEPNPTHTYSEAGSYTVSLTVSNSSGNNTLTKDNYIHVYSIPNLEIEITNASGETENDGSAHVIVTGGTTPYSYLWSNDETSSTISNLAPGAYCVTVTTNDNCIATACGDIEVQNGNSPIANFTADNTQNCGSLTVNFTDLSTNNPQEWLWNFGDGTSSTEQNPQHFYSEAGEYTVSLTCSNEQGNDVIVKENYILLFEKPSLSFEVTDESSTGNADGTITLTITGGTEPYQINWSNNSHGLYLENLSAGLYSVAVIDANNCMNTATVTVGVVTGIANNIKNNISIYPNPSNGNFKIEAEENIISIEITDVSGKVCLQQNVNSKFFEVSENFSSGVYLVKISTLNEINLQKLVIK